MAEPNLLPLKQWYCDVCEELIERPEQGMLQWYHDKDAAGKSVERGFRIVHNAGFSPRRPTGDCYYVFEEHHFADEHLTGVLGTRGLLNLLSFIDVGPLLNPSYRGPQAADLRELTEIIRRLHVPYYEEARQYWDRAREDGFFADASELWPYLPDTSRDVIHLYGGQEVFG
jgi:hypothetical protein